MNSTVKLIIQIVLGLLKYILIPIAENKLSSTYKHEIWSDLRDIWLAVDNGFSFDKENDNG